MKWSRAVIALVYASAFGCDTVADQKLDNSLKTSLLPNWLEEFGSIDNAEVRLLSDDRLVIDVFMRDEAVVDVGTTVEVFRVCSHRIFSDPLFRQKKISYSLNIRGDSSVQILEINANRTDSSFLAQRMTDRYVGVLKEACNTFSAEDILKLNLILKKDLLNETENLDYNLWDLLSDYVNKTTVYLGNPELGFEVLFYAATQGPLRIDSLPVFISEEYQRLSTRRDSIAGNITERHF